MKKLLIILLFLPILFYCWEKKEENKEEENLSKEITKKDAKQECNTLKENTKTDVDLCKCLTEPSNTDWAKENREDCDKAISNKIGVLNWKSVNFSQNTSLSIKWDNMVSNCVNNQLQNDSKESSFTEISFEEAKLFIQERFENIGQLYLNGKVTYHNGGDLKVYYFISQNKQYIGYYCLTGVSSRKLKVLGDVNCGKDEIISAFNIL